MNNTLNEKDAAIVEQILLEELAVGRDQLTMEARLEEDLGADSLTMAEIVIALEARFDQVIPDELAEKVKTVGDVYEVAAGLLRSPARSQRAPDRPAREA